MQLLKFLLVCSTIVTSALAQVNAKLTFTSVPGIAVAGGTYNITWVGGNGTPVTIILREGDPTNLATIAIIADRVTGYSYSWTVSRTLASGVDYSLQLTQGQDQVGYSGPFSIVGGTGTISINAPGVTLPPQSNSSLASASSAASANMTSNAAGPAISNATMAGNATSAAANATSMTSMAANATSAAGSSSGSSRPTSASASSTQPPSSGATAGTPTASQTNFPTVTTGPGVANVPPQWMSFAALMVGVVGAVMGMN